MSNAFKLIVTNKNIQTGGKETPPEIKKIKEAEGREYRRTGRNNKKEGKEKKKKKEITWLLYTGIAPYPVIEHTGTSVTQRKLLPFCAVSVAHRLGWATPWEGFGRRTVFSR